MKITALLSFVLGASAVTLQSEETNPYYTNPVISNYGSADMNPAVIPAISTVSSVPSFASNTNQIYN